MSGVSARLVLFMLTVLAANTGVAGDNSDPHAKHRQMMNEEQESAANSAAIQVPDVRLTTQFGNEVSLRDDVVGDRIVIIDFVYTSCTTICPVLSAILGQLQGRLGERLGEDVVMISLTVDPLRDTPERLKAYSEKHHARDGWVWLTGDKQTVDEVLRAMGAYTPNFEDHPSMMLVGDRNSGEWSRFLGFPGSGNIMEKIDELSAARNAQSAVRE